MRQKRYALYLVTIIVLLLISILAFLPFTQSFATELWYKIRTKENVHIVEHIDDFEIALYSDKNTYGLNDEINIWATMTYIGDEQEIEIYHSQKYLLFSIVNLNNSKVVASDAQQRVGRRSTFVKNEPQISKFAASRVYDEIDEANWQHLLLEPSFSLSPGEYQVNVALDFNDYEFVEVASLPIRVLDIDLQSRAKINDVKESSDQGFPENLPLYIPTRNIIKIYSTESTTATINSIEKITEIYQYFEDGFIQTYSNYGGASIYYVDQSGLYDIDIGHLRGYTGNIIYEAKYRQPYYSKLLLPFPVEEGIVTNVMGNDDSNSYYEITNTNLQFQTPNKAYTNAVEIIEKSIHGNTLSKRVYDEEDGLLYWAIYFDELDSWQEMMKLQEINEIN